MYFPAWTTSPCFLSHGLFPGRVPGLSPQVAVSASVLPNSLLFKFPLKHLYAFDSSTFIFFFPDLLQAARPESGFERAHNFVVIRSQPSLSSISIVCLGSLGWLWPGLVAGQRTSPRQSFISPIAREVTNHHLDPFKQLGALNCTSCTQTASNLPGPGQVH